MPSLDTFEDPSPFVPNRLPTELRIPSHLVRWLSDAMRPLGPSTWWQGCNQGQGYLLCSLSSPCHQMMGSSHLRNSRITLLMGFSARGSCRNCSAALMGILPSEYEKGPWVDARPGCLYPTVLGCFTYIISFNLHSNRINTSWKCSHFTLEVK